MPTGQDILSWRGCQLYGRDGEKVGKIEEIYLDADTNQPEWALVNTGLFGSKSTFVPLRDATSDNDEVHVPYDKAQIKDAPGVEADGRLSQGEEAQLYAHYGLEYSESRSDSGLAEGGGSGGTTVGGQGMVEGRGTTAGGGTGGGDSGAAAGDASPDAGARAGVGSGPGNGGADEAMTRSEEELRVGTTERESGRVRLRKYVETEDVQETVPVRREEARVEREPITDDNLDEATSGPEISEGEHEVVLHEEEVVADKRAVPKERIRLEKDQATEEREVSDSVRKERIDVDESGR